MRGGYGDGHLLRVRAAMPDLRVAAWPESWVRAGGLSLSDVARNAGNLGMTAMLTVAAVIVLALGCIAWPLGRWLRRQGLDHRTMHEPGSLIPNPTSPDWRPGEVKLAEGPPEAPREAVERNPVRELVRTLGKLERAGGASRAAESPIRGSAP